MDTGNQQNSETRTPYGAWIRPFRPDDWDACHHLFLRGKPAGALAEEEISAPAPEESCLVLRDPERQWPIGGIWVAGRGHAVRCVCRILVMSGAAILRHAKAESGEDASLLTQLVHTALESLRSNGISIVAVEEDLTMSQYVSAARWAGVSLIASGAPEWGQPSIDANELRAQA